MNWIFESKKIFKIEKPKHFTDFNHCEECFEHDQTLLNSNFDKIGMEELGNPCWDPICFSNFKGRKYYMPAFIRLSLETIHDEFYFDQFLFHIKYENEKNSLLINFTKEQRIYVVDFLIFMINTHSESLESNVCLKRAKRVLELWSAKI